MHQLFLLMPGPAHLSCYHFLPFCELFYYFYTHVTVIQPMYKLLFQLPVNFLVVTFCGSYSKFVHLLFCDFVLLYHGLNLSFSVLNSPSGVSHFSFSAWVSISNNCNPFVPKQLLISAVFAISGISYGLKTLYTSSLKLFHSLYLSSMSQLNVGCFIIGPILGPMLCLVLICHLFIYIWLLLNICSSLPLWDCLVLISCFVETTFLSLPNTCCLHLPIKDFVLLAPCSISCLIEDNIDVCLYTYLLLCANECNLQYVYVLKYVELVYFNGLYTWLLYVMLYTIDCAW